MANTRDYIAAGMAGARGVRDSFIAARKNAVDYGVLGEANMKARSAQNVAITNATRGVMKAGINAKAKVENTKTKVEADKKVLDTKLGAKRFAGIVGGLGTVAVAGMSFAAPKDNEDSSWKDKHYAAQEALQLQMLERLKNGSDDDGEIPGMQEVPEWKPDEYKPGESSDSSSSSSSASSGDGKTVSSDISAQHSGQAGSKLTKAQIKRYAIQAGFTPEQASTVVGIAGGESGFDPTNSTKRSGLYDKTGEDSVGLMQINWGYHKDSGWLQKLGITKREDLFDPVKNMKAGKYLYDGRGNFGDWTVYNKGIYKDYL